MPIAFLGAVKSGRPYMPIDTAFPQQRIGKILAISRAALVLTPEKTAQFSASAVRAPGNCVQQDDPFYILLTSGSTGEPKGVVITLGCVEYFINWVLAEQKFIEQNEIFLNQPPFSFDVSVMGLYCGLVTGGTVFSISRDLVADPKMLYRALANSDVTTWVSTPSFAQMCLVEDKFGEAMLPRVRRFLFCGETLAPQIASRLLERFPRAQVWNTYGPTETTVATTSVRIDHAILEKYSPLPIGRPMPGSEVFVVDEKGEALPANKRGEIIIAGPNVSPGYLGRPDSQQMLFSNIAVSALIVPAIGGDFVTICFFSKAASMSKSSSTDIASNSAISNRTCERCRLSGRGRDPVVEDGGKRIRSRFLVLMREVRHRISR